VAWASEAERQKVLKSPQGAGGAGRFKRCSGKATAPSRKLTRSGEKVGKTARQKNTSARVRASGNGTTLCNLSSYCEKTPAIAHREDPWHKKPKPTGRKREAKDRRKKADEIRGVTRRSTIKGRSEGSAVAGFGKNGPEL